ncbi:MAG TPA: prolipoprotein diacylglyceryl transferase family protein [Stellaceae bacterium]|nr:prolipoprotein diacylglyceryl transferase family protein [Stellaceae bacterium]
MKIIAAHAPAVESHRALLVHSVFDLLALIAALAAYRLCPAAADGVPAEPWRVHSLYVGAGAAGATAGAYLFGSLNLWLTGIAGVGRSIEGAIAGGIVGIEALKHVAGIRGSTGLRFVAPLAAAIAVGRIGCFLAGLDDMTYGTPTALPWAVDFGDGVPRHPVQLYESAAMAVFLTVFLFRLGQGDAAVRRTGFYLFVGVYAAQRFAWEFLKPYGTVLGPFNVFHLLSLALIAYAVMFARRELRPHVAVGP